MATVIDSLIVSLGLDPSAFTKGQKEAAASIAKTREQAQKHGAGIEKSMDGASEAVDRLARNALKLFAVFTAGRAIKDFVADVTSADAALGRLAKSVGSTPDVISSLGNAVARNGGSATAAAGSFERLADSINEIKTTGNSPILPFLYRLQGLGGKQINLNKELSETFGDLAENAKNIADRQGVPFATYLLKQAGVDRDTAALLVKGREAYNKALAESRRIGIVRKEDTEAAQKLETSLESLRQTSEGFGRTILTAITPTVTDLIERMREWITANQDWIKTEIVTKIREFADWLKSIDWNSILSGIRGFIRGADDAAKAVGGWKVVAEAFFALWAASKMAALFAPLLLQIAGVRLALLGLGPFGAALLGLGALAGVAGLATADQLPKVLGREGAAGVDPGTGGATERPPMDLYGQEGGARPWLRRQWNRTKRLFGGGSADAAEGGAGIRTRAARAARGDQSGGVAANPGAYKDVLDHIARSEGTANQAGGGYNTSLGYGRYLPGGKEQNLTSKTLDEILELGNHMRRQPGNPNSSAMGRYQIVGSTLRAQMRQLGLKGSDLFDEKTQDRIGANLARQRGANSVGLQQEWASLVGAKNATAVALMQKVDRNASTIPLDRPSAPSPADTTRRDVLADPNDERRKIEAQKVAESVAAAQVLKSVQESQKQGTLAERAAAGSEYGPQTPYPGSRSIKQMNDWLWDKKGPQPIDWKKDPETGNWKPVFAGGKPSAALGAQRAGAQAAIAQVQAAQTAAVSTTANDNRTTSSVENNINGPINIHTAATDASGIARDIKPALQRHAFAAAANYARA